jgi:hypothetical protein
MMKTISIFLLVCWSSVSCALELTNTAGTVYSNVEIQYTDPTGLFITHRKNGRTIGEHVAFSKLPETIQKEYGYNPQKSVEYKAELDRRTLEAEKQRARDESARKEREQIAAINQYQAEEQRKQQEAYEQERRDNEQRQAAYAAEMKKQQDEYLKTQLQQAEDQRIENEKRARLAAVQAAYERRQAEIKEQQARAQRDFQATKERNAAKNK